jgi:hypothetical protein
MRCTVAFCAQRSPGNKIHLQRLSSGLVQLRYIAGTVQSLNLRTSCNLSKRFRLVHHGPRLPIPDLRVKRSRSIPLLHSLFELSGMLTAE